MNTRRCSWPHCTNRHDSRGYCKNHAKRALSEGLLSKLPDHSAESPRERLYRIGWSVTPNGCWEWAGPRDRKDYGFVTAGGRSRRAHRVSYEVHAGPIPPGLVVMHACDNPPCVNPEHLSVGTSGDNVRDMVRKGRANLAGLALGRPSSADSRAGDRSYRNPSAKLTADEVRAFRALVAGGISRAEAARRFGISKSQGSRIARGVAWRQIA